jgi:hypothetical protein
VRKSDGNGVHAVTWDVHQDNALLDPFSDFSDFSVAKDCCKRLICIVVPMGEALPCLTFCTHSGIYVTAKHPHHPLGCALTRPRL